MNATARFAGSVQGVVVQMTAETRLPASSACFARSAAYWSSFSAKRTSIDGLVWFSSYSTSASASAVRHEMHQWTDFLAL